MSAVAPEAPAPLDALDPVEDWLDRHPRPAIIVGVLALTSPITVPLIAWAINLGVTL